MTSRIRLWTAVLACVLAVIWGWVAGASPQQPSYGGQRSGLVIPRLAATEDVDRYAQVIFDQNLFPDASLRLETPREDTPGAAQTADEFERSVRDPSLSAFVKREDAWRIILYGVGEGAQIREIGDQLADGWVIQNIDATSVLLTNGEDSRRIEVFKAEPDTQ